MLKHYSLLHDINAIIISCETSQFDIFFFSLVQACVLQLKRIAITGKK